MRTLRAVKFLFMGPIILVFLFMVNLLTWHGRWWVQYAALGIGISWFFSLLRVLRAIVVAGGLAAFGAYLFSRNSGKN